MGTIDSVFLPRIAIFFPEVSPLIARIAYAEDYSRHSLAEHAATEEKMTRECKRRAALGRGRQRREAPLRGETIIDDLRMQAISCCAFAQLLEHLVCP